MITYSITVFEKSSLGVQVSDNYELRFDGSLPARDPRDRNPGTGGC